MNSIARTSTPDLLAQAREIFARANALQLHDPATPRSARSAQLRHEASRWLDLATDTPAPQTATAALQMAQAIDLIHRIANSLPAPAALTNPLILCAFEAHVHGDQSITAYDLFPHIESALRRKDPAYFGRPLVWHSLQVTAWLRNFRNPRRPAIKGDDLRHQARLLLQTDLTPYHPNPLPLLSALPSYL